MRTKRVFLIVLDSFGIGYEPDAADFGDVGSNTLKSIRISPEFSASNLDRLGLFHIDGVQRSDFNGDIAGAIGRMREKSRGKDTTAGHWEIAGLVTEKPFPLYPNGFPEEIIKEFEEKTGRKVLCNKPYSGTEVIKDFGKEHEETGGLIVYTSADSVFQVAANEQVVPLEELYEDCRIAREILQGDHGVGRVIARPFTGTYPKYERTANRHDFSLVPPKKTMLNYLQERGFATISIGKINDIFAGSGISSSMPTTGNRDGMEQTLKMAESDFTGLCFINLVDFDMKYGHRNDVDGYAKAIAEFDRWLERMIARMRMEDILIITADHGCDPGYPTTDHTREYVPMIICGSGICPGANIGTRNSFADIGATVLDLFNVKGELDGKSFKNLVIR